MKETSTVDRASLGFAEAVQAALEVVALGDGLRLVEAGPTRVRYESDRVFLNIYHGRQSYEIGVEVGLLADGDSRKFGLPDVLAAVVGSSYPGRTYFQASNAEAVTKCAGEIAALIDDYYGPVLAGERETWERIAAVADERNTAYTKEIVQRPIREAATEAWAKGDYQKVRELYQSIRSDLSPVEKKRLAYAEKHSR
jgi:hypothetical protein